MAGNLTAMIASIFSGGVTPDPYFEYTTLLLPGNGTNGAQNNTFLDGSTNNFTITRNGNTTQGTSSPFSQTGWGNYFDGNGDYLDLSDNAAFQFGSGDFTYECWVFPIKAYGSTVSQGLISYGVPGMFNNTYTINLQLNPTTGYAEINVGYTTVVTGTTQVPLNQWSHIVACRTSGRTSVFVNGIREATSTTSVTITTSAGAILRLGGQWYANSADRQLGGYLSNVRVIKGTGPYDAASTTINVPTAPLTAITNTSLLTCQSNRFIDNSTNNFAITVTGSPSVQAFSPFNPLLPWTAANNGGSGYFDGSGDYLSAADNAAFTLGTNNWTLEGWFYANSYPNYARLWGQSTAGATGNNAVGLFFDTGGIGTGINIRYGTTSNQTNDTGFITIDAGKYQWHHIAVVRDVNTMRLYFNGVQKTTVSLTGVTIYDSSAVFAIGANSGGTENWDGYLSNVRLVNGTCLYPNGTSFTPSTTPFTAITNTSLLLNYTNAGIYDATSKNDLETVGGAQISTAQSKWGGSSMAFDGNGDYLLGPSSQYIAFPSDFTFECWLYRTASTGEGTLFYNPTSGGINIFMNISSNWGIASSGIAVDNNFGSPPSTNTWNHIAVSRSGSTIKAFVNGTQVFSGTNTKSYVAGSVQVGFSSFGTITGYIQDLRVTKYARYTSNFTAPTAAFPTL